MKLVASFDGCYSMKRDIGAGAGVVYLPDGAEIAHAAQFLRHATTPIAEYTALICALNLALELGATEITCWGDAESVCRQIQDQKDNPHGSYAVRVPTLIPLNGMAKLLMSRFDRADVFELPRAGPKNKRRHNNVRADEIANESRETASSFKRIHEQPGGQRWTPT